VYGLDAWDVSVNTVPQHHGNGGCATAPPRWLTQDVWFWQEMMTLMVENVNIDDLSSGLSG
jgi:hypothetical protein